MALRPLGYGTVRARQSQPSSMVAPIGGLNNRDALGAMSPTDAYQLDNWFPQQDGCVTRNGHEEHATDMFSDVETVAVYAGGASPQLIAFAGGSLYNATAAGAVGAAITSGRSGNKVITTMFSNAATQFMIGVNGVDEPFRYDGTTYTGLTITGISTSQEDLAYVFSYKKRLYFAANGELGFYYLASEAIQGAADYFELSQIFRRGGYLLAIGSLTQSMGDGPDDLIFFVSSVGEVAIYQGTDPGDAAAWALVGTYYVGTPIGRRCITKYGGDSLLITDMGLLPLSGLFQKDDPSPTEDAISFKLGRALQSHNQYRNTYGWHATLHPANTMLLLNVPQGADYYQYVMNTITGAWCRFIGWTALCFAEMGGELFFGGKSGVVYKADSGQDDNGTPIRCNAKQAYSRFNEANNKHWLNARIKIEFTGSPPISVGFNVDYAENTPQYVGEAVTSGEGDWDDSDWDTTDWAIGADVQSKWLDINKIGFAGAMWLRAEVSTATLRWFETEYLYKVGGPI